MSNTEENQQSSEQGILSKEWKGLGKEVKKLKREESRCGLPEIASNEELHLFGALVDKQRHTLKFREQLESTSIKAAIDHWIRELMNRSTNTAKSYRDAMKRLIDIGALQTHWEDGRPKTLDDFRLMPHERVVDFIKQHSKWKEDSRQARAAAYITFTRWLSRLSEGWIREAKPQVCGTNKTFYKTRSKVATEALPLEDCYRLLDAIYAVNARDGLIAKAIFGGARRISEVLQVPLSRVSWEKNTITYRVSKTQGLQQEVAITYSPHFMPLLKKYVEETAEARGDIDLLFITNNGKQVVRQRLNDTFAKASKQLGWLNDTGEGIKASPHMLRTSWITIARQQGFSADDIGEVTGQSSVTVRSYDKHKVEENISKKLQVV